MERQDPVEAARAALAAGRPWEARDRITGVRAHRPHDVEVLAILGDAWWQLGDARRAGRYWFLTDREGPEVDAAVAAWRLASRAADRARLLQMQPPDQHRYPPAALARVAELVDEVAVEGDVWVPGQPVRQPGQPVPSTGESRLADLAGLVAVALVVAATLGVWVAGLIAILGWVFG